MMLDFRVYQLVVGVNPVKQSLATRTVGQRHRLWTTGFVFLCVLVCSTRAIAAGWVVKVASESWTWLDDYLYVGSGTYLVACDPGRQCVVGSGVFAFGSPRGNQTTFSGQKEITVIGVGSLHVRAADGKGQLRAAYLLKDHGLVTVPVITW